MDTSRQTQELLCPKCFRNFSESGNIPHILPCSHSYCHRCLKRLGKSNYNSCLRCNAPINADLMSTFPINSAILEYLKSLQSSHSESKIYTFDKMIKTLNGSLFESKESKNEFYQKYKSFKRRVNEIEEFENKNSRIVIEGRGSNQKRRKMDNQDIMSVSKSLELLAEKRVSTLNHPNEYQMIPSNHDRSEQEQNFQLYLDAPQAYYILSESTNKRTTYFTIQNLMYINSFPRQLSCMQNLEIKINMLRPIIQKAFIKFGYGNSSSLVEFEMFDINCTRAQHFLKRCLGEEQSFLNAEIYNHNRVGLEGESFCIGIEGDDATDKSLNIGCYKNIIREGYVAAATNTKKINHFKIYLEKWDSKNCYTFLGRVSKGLDGLKSAIKSNLKLKILECGVIADPALEKL